MTDTASHVSSPGGAGMVEGNTDDALSCFERESAVVFASICRITAGDREFSEQLLHATFGRFSPLSPQPDVGPAGRCTRRSLLLTAHRLYLSDPRAEDDHWTDPFPAGELPWSNARSDLAVAAARSLTSLERVALSAHLIDGFDLDDIAGVIGTDAHSVTELIESGQRALNTVGSRDTTTDILRHAELWLGDDVRESIRVSLGAPSRGGSSGGAGENAGPHPRRWRDVRATRATWIGSAIVAALVVLGVLWVRGLPDDIDGQSVALDQPSQSSVSGSLTADAIAPERFVMASGLADPQVVVPEWIVRYSDGTLGLSWHSPCNRPALAVSVTSTRSGLIIELTTGAFDVVSCVGMPDRWTAVIAPSTGDDVSGAGDQAIDGPIRAFDADGNVVSSFDRYEADAPIGAEQPVEAGAGYGSALVDDNDDPWIFGLGCASSRETYTSPAGPIFEVRRGDTPDQTSYSASDAIICNQLASRPVLTGPLGSTFPRIGSPDDHVECTGPGGSPRDLIGDATGDDLLSDDRWTTWDGCLVRTDTITSRSVFENCPGADIRTITVATEIGQRMAEGVATLTFIRDPAHSVDGTRPPFLTYSVWSRDLYDSGLRDGTNELWLSPGSSDAIYLRVGEVVERWPVLTDSITCTERAGT